LPGKDDTGPPGESSDGSELDQGKGPEESTTPEGGGAGQDEALEKDDKDLAVCRESKPHVCASGHCCGRRDTRRVIISRYFGDN
jgi:hypothetical protein